VHMKKTKYSTKKKAVVALSAIRGEKISKLSSTHQIHPNVKDKIIDELYKIIGQREVEISWLKKKYKLDLPREITLD